jgi:lipopolysaccharide export system permease protein
MDLFGRYIFRQTAGAALMILITLTTIVWVSMALKYASILTTQEQGVVIFFKVTMLSMPNLVSFVAPVALWLASMHTLNRLSSDSELIIVSAAGGTIWRVIKPYMALALMVSLFVLFSNAYLQPLSMQLLRSYIMKMRGDFMAQVLQPGAFVTVEKGLTLHIRERDPQTSDMLGLIFQDERDSRQFLTYLAERARVIKLQGDPSTEDDDQMLLVMETGQVQRLDPKTGEIRYLTFDSYRLDLSNMGPKQEEYKYKASERYLTDLMNPDWSDYHVRSIAGKIRAELHNRLATPFYPIFFVLLAVIYLGQPQTTRQGRGDYVLGAFFVGAVSRGAGVAAQNMLVKQVWAISLVYGIPGIGIVVMLLMARYNLKPVVLSLGSLKLPRLRFWKRAAT